MGKYDDLFEAPAQVPATGKYADLFDQDAEPDLSQAPDLPPVANPDWREEIKAKLAAGAESNFPPHPPPTPYNPVLRNNDDLKALFPNERLRNFIAAGANTVAGFIPASVHDIKEMLAPQTSERFRQELKDADARYREVESTPPYSQERFERGLGLFAQTAMALSPLHPIAKELRAKTTAPLRPEEAPVTEVKPVEAAKPVENVAPKEDVVPVSETPPPGAKIEAPFIDEPAPQVTSTKNAVVAAEREARGMEPAEQSAARDFGTVWDEASAVAEKDPGAGARLVDELQEKPRALNDRENALLLREQIKRQNEHDAAIQAVNENPGDANTQARLDAARDSVQKVYDAGKAAGTETGRGLNARKMLAAQDFTLAKMEAETRAVVNRGEPLSESQANAVKDLHERIAVAEAKLSAYEARDAFEAALRDAKATKAQVPFKVTEFLDRQADAARTRIAARRGRLYTGIDPAALVDEAIIGASHIARGVTKFAEWSDAMLTEFGDAIRPHLQAIYAKAREMASASARQRAQLSDETRLAMAKKRASLGTKMIQRKIEAGDTSPLRPKREPINPDKELTSLQYEYAKAKDSYKRMLIEAQLKQRSVPQKVLGGIGEAFNTTRALMTSFDLSAVLRQGGFVTFGHPIRALKAVPDMFRALASEKGQFRVNQEILNRPNAPLYAQSKLYLASDGPGVSLSKMEEAYASRLAKKIPGVSHSERAYTTFLNRLRADSFDAMAATLTKYGKPTIEEARAIANFVNVATGRGELGQYATAANALNKVFFAPRYVASRFQLLAGQPLYRGTARTRALIASEYARTLAGAATVYGLGVAAGGAIETDPRSADFGKIRFGNTRLDPLFGVAQTSVLLSRLASGKTKHASTGKITPIRGNVPYGGQNAFDVTTAFLRSKLAPIPGAFVDVETGKNVVGQPVTPRGEALNLLTPISFQDIYKAMQDQGVPRGTAFAVLSLLGMGLQVYQPKTKPAKSATAGGPQ